ncbi:hypothetical protein BST29_12005 [Mycobacterium malmoense]|uniref:Peptidase M10 metallopeptidase domain-containing protein n=1 Tax=Mycobacterium malmoense TaxID=1780 RepID=A0ABX3SSN1_MYCMA|nr:hypothetical protein BST29_12005 [Mycobacterium malmoense]
MHAFGLAHPGRGLNWDGLPLKLFSGGNAKFWDPADIDFFRDDPDAASASRRRVARFAGKSCDSTSARQRNRYPIHTVLALQNSRMPWPESSRP